jgi:TrpR-related protein YerC/YecD
MHGLQSESVNRLMEVIARLDTKEACQSFFEDICTVKELLDMAQRLDVAILLRNGENYQSISQKVNVSTATISRVSKCLNYGSGGYADALDKLTEGIL